MSRFADVTSDTPHGPRPVPEDHIPTEDPPPAPAPKSLRSTLLVWGGLGLALTVGALAARAAADALAGDREDRPRQPPRPRHAPGYAALDAEARDRMRARAQADFADYEDRAEEIRAAALRARRRRRRPPQTASLGDNIGAAARNVTALIGAAATALEAFRQVSTNSDEIIRDFSNAADRLHEFLNPRSGDTPEREAEAERTENDKRMRNL